MLIVVFLKKKKKSRVSSPQHLTLVYGQSGTLVFLLSGSLPGNTLPPSALITPPTPRPRLRRGSLATSLKDRKWLMVPPGVRWVGSEGRLGERIPDSKISLDGRVARAGISEMTMTSARVILPLFPRQASQSSAVNSSPSIFTAWLGTKSYQYDA